MHRFQTAALAATLAITVGLLAGCPDPARAPKEAAAGTTATAKPGAAAATPDTGAVTNPLVAEADASAGFKPSSVVAHFDGKTLTLAALDKEAAAQLSDARKSYLKKVHDIRSHTLEGYIDDQLLRAAAKAAGETDPKAYLKKTIDANTPDPSEKDITDFYTQNKSRMGGAPIEAVHDRIKSFLSMQAKRKKFNELMAQLKAKAKVTTNIPEARTKVAAVGPSKGPKTAPVTIVEFSDFQCPYCKRVLPTVDKIIATYGDKIHLVRRDFPLPFHQYAEKAAEAGQCAKAQGKFWQMHDEMYDNQDQLAVDGLKKLAAEVKGLDTGKFDKCLDSGAMKGKIQSEIAAGKAAGVSGTPAFFINGIEISGAQPFDSFKKIIDQELESAKASGSRAD